MLLGVWKHRPEWSHSEQFKPCCALLRHGPWLGSVSSGTEGKPSIAGQLQASQNCGETAPLVKCSRILSSLMESYLRQISWLSSVAHVWLNRTLDIWGRSLVVSSFGNDQLKSVKIYKDNVNSQETWNNASKNNLSYSATFQSLPYKAQFISKFQTSISKISSSDSVSDKNHLRVFSSKVLQISGEILA